MFTPESRAAAFPSLAGKAYLNTAAESVPPLVVHEALEEYWRHKQLGMDGRDHHFPRVEACRESAARLLGRSPGEIGFCSCSSEAYNLLASALDLSAGDEVVVSDLDFPAGATPWLAAARPPLTHVWRARGGELRPEDLEPLLSERTRLVQVSLVSFHNGHRVSWAPLRDLVRRRAPRAVLSVDVTQAFGRVELDCHDADCLISSTHKWLLALHGGCVVAVPEASAERLTTHAGGWCHIENAFAADRFEKAVVRKGAASFSVGMPNFAALYGLHAALEYLGGIGIGEIARRADPLVRRLQDGLADLGIVPLAPRQDEGGSGIVAFTHPRSPEIHAALLKDNIHVMHHAGRLRVAVHGYNTLDDVERLLATLRRVA